MNIVIKIDILIIRNDLVFPNLDCKLTFANIE